jgi:phospholipid/cholesterol/gamma-HCH transport system ATP-binding protein
VGDGQHDQGVPVSDVLLECNDLAVGYDDQVVVEHVDLRVTRGEIVVLLGGSGSGKSTLLRAFTGLLPPMAGELRVLGQPLYEIPVAARHDVLRRTGTAFLSDALFGSMTVGDNIALPLRELTRVPEPVIKEMVRMRLGMVGLAGLEQRLPASLSGGQRKRAALARASILDPDLMFCDEPTAGLDPAVAATIDETLLQLRSSLGTTMVVVTHELASIRTIADRAVMIGDGAVIARGTVAELESSTETSVFKFFHRVAG